MEGRTHELILEVLTYYIIIKTYKVRPLPDLRYLVRTLGQKQPSLCRNFPFFR